MDIERVIVRMMADASPYHRVMDSIESRMQYFVRHSTPWGAALSVPFVAAAASVAALGVTMGSAGRTAITMAASFEQAGIALEVMTGSAETAKKLLDELTALAIKTPFRSTELVAGAKMLAAFGVETKDITDTLKVLGDVASGVNTGNLDQTLGRIILAYGQVRTAGRLMGTELRQFTEAGVPILKSLAIVMGQPIERMKALVEEGRVGITEVEKAFNHMVSNQGRFNNLMERQSQSAAGRWSAFVETLELGAKKIGDSFIRNFRVKELLDDMSAGVGTPQGLDDFFRQFREGVDDVVGIIKVVWYAGVQAFNWIADVVKDIKQWGRENKEVIATIIGILAVTNTFRLAVYAVVTALGLLRAGLIAVRALLGINALLSLWTTLGVVLAAVLSPLNILLGMLGGLVYLMTQLDQSGGMFENFGQAFSKMAGEAVEMFTKVFQGISDAVKSGDTKLAFDILFLSIKFAWKSMLVALEAEWTRFKLNITGVGTANGVVDSWKAFLAIGMNEVEIRLSWLFSSEEEFQAKFKEFKEAQKKILQQHSGGEVNRASAVQKEVDLVMAQTAPIKKELEDLILKAKMQARSAEIEQMVRSNTPEIRKLESEASGLFAQTFMSDLAREGMTKTFLSYFTDAMGGAGARLGPDGRMTTSATFLASSAAYPGGSRFGISPFPTQEQLAATRGFEIQKRLSELNPNYMGLGFAANALSSANRIQSSLVVSSEARLLANEVNKQYQSSQFQFGPKFDKFMKDFSNLQEARYGPISPYPGGMLSGAGSILGPSEYQAGVFSRYSALAEYVNKRTETGTRAMFAGSSDAADTIARNQAQSVTLEDEIRQTLIQSKIIQGQQADYQRRTVEILEKLGVDDKAILKLKKEGM